MVAEVYPIAGILAARIAGEDPEMDRVARTLQGLVKSEAAKHRLSGQFGASIIVQRARGKRGVMDRIVVATDPLAAIKEFGHRIVTKDGDEVGYVKGMHTMAKAIQRLPAVPDD